MIDPKQLDDVEVIARTLWGEARNQGEPGMAAVASVIQNRALSPGWWGHDPRSVCLAAQQFSCWNRSDPQAKFMRSEAIRDASIEVAREVAWKLYDGNLVDTVKGADHYCTEAVVGKTRWAKGRTPVAKVGTHLFFKIGLTA